MGVQSLTLSSARGAVPILGQGIRIPQDEQQRGQKKGE